MFRNHIKLGLQPAKHLHKTDPNPNNHRFYLTLHPPHHVTCLRVLGKRCRARAEHGEQELDEFLHGGRRSSARGSSIGRRRRTRIGRGRGRGSRSSHGDEDAPFAVHVLGLDEELVLVGLELLLAEGGIDDEGAGLGAEAADGALADVEGVWRGDVSFKPTLIAGFCEDYLLPLLRM